MGWIKDRILSEFKKHGRSLDWSAIAEAKIIKQVTEIIKDFEKKNTEVIKTEDLIKEKIIIADYIKWDKFRELNKEFVLDEQGEKQ